MLAGSEGSIQINVEVCRVAAERLDGSVYKDAASASLPCRLHKRQLTPSLSHGASISICGGTHPVFLCPGSMYPPVNAIRLPCTVVQDPLHTYTSARLGSVNHKSECYRPYKGNRN